MTCLYNRSLHSAVFPNIWKMSKVTALFKSGSRLDTILENMDNGQLTGVAFLDLSKAFDMVNHSRLLLKLKSIGFSFYVCEWFKSYLTHRCQVTVVDNKQSSVMPVNIGVPQGSILGPLLFIIYVNELPNCITSCDISMYADDTVFFFSSKSVKNIEGKLNEDLANVQKWFRDNLLTLNEKKSKFMLIGGHQRLKSC